MKKFFALVLACASLTAVAAGVNEASEGPVQAVTFQTPLDYMKAHNISWGNNKGGFGMNQDGLVALSGKYMTYLHYAHYRTDGSLIDVEPCYSGNTTCKYKVSSSGTLQISGLFKNTYNNTTYYLPMTVDYENGTVQLSHSIKLKSIDPSSTEPTRVDTVLRHYVYSEGYYRNKDTSAKINGKLLPDGSIMFGDGDGEGYVYYWYQIITKYEDGVKVSCDTTSYYNVYRGTQLVVANGLHEYYGKDGMYNSANVYLYQPEGDSTVLVWNLWGIHYPCNYMNIGSDGTVDFPRQKVRYADASSYDTDTRDYTSWWYNVGCDYIDGTVSNRHSGCKGTITPDSLNFETTLVHDYYTEGGSTYYGKFYGPYLDNKLTFTNGAQFVVPVVDEGVRGDVNGDESVDPSDISALIDYLLNGSAVNEGNADCDLNGSIDPGDISALIDFLLNSVWPAL